jgi:putative alpha-1,2-mannosidase
LKLDKGTVTITGGDENKCYIQSLMLNGKPYEGTWLPLDKIQNGATLEYKMGSKASGWGGKVEPPSFN